MAKKFSEFTAITAMVTGDKIIARDVGAAAAAQNAEITLANFFGATTPIPVAVALGNTLTVGADDTGYDVQFFGATAGAYWLWDESADRMILENATMLIGDDSTIIFGDGSDATVEYDENGTDQLRWAGATHVSPGIQFTPQARTATADGLTTGLISLGVSFVEVTSASANNIVTLPAGTPGQVIHIYVGANGCELRTPAASGATINNVDSDGTNELALGATTSYIAVCVATDTWIVRGFTNLGADQAALVPDAA